MKGSPFRYYRPERKGVPHVRGNQRDIEGVTIEKCTKFELESNEFCHLRVFSLYALSGNLRFHPRAEDIDRDHQPLYSKDRVFQGQNQNR